MSPSLETISTKAICNDECCGCIGSAKNRTSSPSSTSLHLPTNIGSEISVSSNSFRRETSPTVCCYNIDSRSQSIRKKNQNKGNFETFHRNNLQNQKTFKSDVGKNLSRESRENFGEKSFSYLNDKIRKFENPPSNIHENIINRSTTTIRTEAKADVNPVKCVSENDQRISDDKNSSRNTFLINRDESQSKRISPIQRCSSKKILIDGYNNQVGVSSNSSLNAKSLRDTSDTSTHHFYSTRDGDIKVSKVVIKRLMPIVLKCKPQVTAVNSNQQPLSPQVVPKPSSLDSNDFCFIDASSRSSSTTFNSEDFGVIDVKANQRKAGVPKTSRFNNNNYCRELSVKTSDNPIIYSYDLSAKNGWNTTETKNSFIKYNKVSFKNNECLKEPTHSLSSPLQSEPQRSTMDKSSLNTLKKFGFGRKNPPSSSSSPERKPGTSKTERLKELTEKLKGKTGSFKISPSRSVSPLKAMSASAPIPPPRKLKRNSNDITSSSFDNLLSLEPAENQSTLYNIGKSKSVEPSSIFSLKSIQERFLRPNHSASNLESLNHPRELLCTSSLREEDFFTKLDQPESRTIVGSYTQRSIPFRSASFSQADVSSGKNARTDIASLKASLAQGRRNTLIQNPSPKKQPVVAEKYQENKLMYPLESVSVTVDDTEESSDVKEASSKRNSDIETIAEEPMAESLAERHEEQIKDKLTQINVVQASEMMLETLIEEEPSAMSISPKIQTTELQQATTCLIPIPVFECVEKEWSPLPEHDGEEFCHPISQDVLPQAKVIENFIEVRVSQSEDGVETLESDPEIKACMNDYLIPSSVNPNIPGVELNNVVIQLDEITEKLKETVPQLEVCNSVKTQIPQNKEELVTQKSTDIAEEIQEISPEIHEVLATIAESLHEEHKFLTNSVGNASINLASLICPDQDLNLSDRESIKVDLLKAVESSPEPSSYEKSDNELGETVRKRHSNDVNSGSEKSSSNNASPNNSNDDKRKIDKSRRRKGIYIQWPAVERSQEIDSFDSSTAEDVDFVAKRSDENHSSEAVKMSDKKQHRNRNLSFNFSEPAKPDSPCSLEPYTPDSDCACNSKPLVWPKPSRRQSLTYQSSDERDDPVSTHPSPLKPFRNDSISDNESDRGSSIDRTPSSSATDQDLRRYSKRPLRGPYGQMLEAEMKKPTKVHYDGILEELSRDSIGSRGSGFFSSVGKSRKSGGSLPVPMHQRTVSSPVPLIETTCPDALPFHHKRYPSSVDHRTSVTMTTDTRITFKHDNKKLSLDSHLTVEKSPKRTSSDTSDKQLKKNFEKHQAKRSLDEIRMPTTPADKCFILNTPETPKNMAATPELLAELLKGSSEKLLNEQNHNKKHQSRNSSTINGISPPTASSLNSLDTRTHVVVELFNTEKSYVESLQTIVIKYLNPLKLPESSGVVDLQTVDEIFFMVPSILHIHEKFLDELRKRLDAWDQMQQVGDSFYDVFSKPIVLETYTAFVNNWNKAKDAIRTTTSTKPAFAKFLEAMAREHKGKLSLDNLLIKIIQKFPNYELMLQRLIKHTDAEHPDYNGCTDAHKLVHDILVHLNCKEREALENGQREATLRELENVIEGISDLVSGDRMFLSFELVSMPSGPTGRKERGFFLFNDLLVITSIKKRSGTIRKPNSVPGSFTSTLASTLDTNKYKFLTKLMLDDLEIVKSKDENIHRIMKEIEHLSEDASKLQQLLDLSSTLRCSHQTLEESIRDLQLNVQRQLVERQGNDSQLNLLELNLNAPSGTKNMSIVFSKPEKRSQFEENFTEAKLKLIASYERFQVPECIASVPIRKTRAGLQFTCAAATLGTQKDVWVCNSDGYVGQVCILSLNSLEPTVTSCNGVCNARILCVTSVPGYMESSDGFSHTKNLNFSINSHDETQSSLLSISNSPTVSNKTAKVKSAQIGSNIQLDSSSSSDSEPEPLPDRPASPSSVSNSSQIPVCDDSESQMWLGTEDGFIHVYNCTDNIRIKKNKIKIQHVSAVTSILYLDNRVFVSLANGDIYIYARENSSWKTNSPMVLTVGSVTSPVTKLLNVNGKLWCSIQGAIKILNTSTFQVENNVEISNDAKPISNMTLLNNHVWISMQNSAIIQCCGVHNLKTICEVNLAPAVNKMLSNCDNIIQQHKAACLRVTSLLASKDVIWVGTSAGVLLTIVAQNIGKSLPVVTGIPQGHTGQVRFLTTVEIDENIPMRKMLKKCDSSKENGLNYGLIISGGDGFEDFRTTGANTMNEVAGREDSTNHLIMWQHAL